ncbi:MAG: glycosyltransferase family 2 protein [Rhodothermales bacterium]
MDLTTIDVIIPALNEEASLPRVLADIPGSVRRVVVADNGSTDRTADVARDAGATVVHEPKRGYGHACLAGMALLEADPPDIVVFLDGDYSDYPEELTRLTAPITEGRADFVVGSRTRGERTPGALLPQAIFGNWLACTLMRWIWGTSWTDLGPFRAVRHADLQRLDMQDTTYGWTIEMQIKAATAGLRTEEIPVSYRSRIGQSKVTGTVSGTIKAGIWILGTIARYAIRNPRTF